MDRQNIENIFSACVEVMDREYGFHFIKVWGGKAPTIKMRWVNNRSYLGQVSTPRKTVNDYNSVEFAMDRRYTKPEKFGEVRINEFYIAHDVDYDIVKTIIHELCHLYFPSVQHPKSYTSEAYNKFVDDIIEDAGVINALIERNLF